METERTGRWLRSHLHFELGQVRALIQKIHDEADLMGAHYVYCLDAMRRLDYLQKAVYFTTAEDVLSQDDH